MLFSSCGAAKRCAVAEFFAQSLEILPHGAAITQGDAGLASRGRRALHGRLAGAKQVRIAAAGAIAQGQDRILLVMATGTGKTYTAFQIIWRLWKAGRKKRILFLADRNVPIDQTMVNDFRPFSRVMAKLSTHSKTIERDDGTEVVLTTALDKRRRIDPSYEVYLGLYQAITGPEERQKQYREFSPGFFDLIVIDECHRGSAAADSAWREILDHFSSATQIGLTATPRLVITESESPRIMRFDQWASR